MFEVDLDNIESDEGVWFDYQESHFDKDKGVFVFDPPNSDASIRVRRIGKFIADSMAKRKQKEKIVLNTHSKRMERITYYEDEGQEVVQAGIDAAFDYAITGLKGFKNKKTGDVVECTKDNKIALMKIPAFDRFIAKCFRVLGDLEEEDEKNLPTPQTG